jgi:hypothetical protein
MSDDAAVTANFVASPALSVSPAALSFGKVKMGTASAPKIVTIRNTGTTGSSLTIGTPAITGSNASEFAVTSTCASPLAKGASCTLSVTFTPRSYASASASLGITSDALSKGTASIKLTGVSGPPRISVVPGALTFPATGVGSTPVPSRTVTVKNTGLSELVITSVAARDGTDASFSVTSDCATLQQNGTCKATVSFNPASSGRKMGWIDITSNASSKPATARLTGLAK